MVLWLNWSHRIIELLKYNQKIHVINPDDRSYLSLAKVSLSLNMVAWFTE
jgi:hypothetical protein